MHADRRRTRGELGEQIAERHLERRGYRVVERNFRTRYGEIDLIVVDTRAIVFCEVKTRRSDRFGAPVEAITHKKRQRLRLLAAKWLDDQRAVVRELRFDVASVTPGPDGRLAIEVLEGAF